MNHTNEAWEEEQMSNLGCESVSDLIAEVKRWRELKIAEEDELEQLCNRAEYYEDEYNLTRRANQELLVEVKRLREALITVQQSLVWDEKDRAMDGDSITLEALVVQVEQVRSNITEMIE